MADIALGSLEKIVKVGLAIKKAVETVRQNKEECRDVERYVATVIALLSLLNETTETMMNPPEITGALEYLGESLDKALELITDCQERNAVHRILTSGDMATKLRRVKDDIHYKLTLANLATTVLHITITRYGSAYPPFAQPQDAGEVNIPYSSHSTTGDARSGVNREVTTVATRSNVPLLPGFSLSESLEATTNHVSQENNIIGGGGHSIQGRSYLDPSGSRDPDEILQFHCKSLLTGALDPITQMVMIPVIFCAGFAPDSIKVRVVMKVEMKYDIIRSKTMQLVAAICGIESVNSRSKTMQLVTAICGIESVKLVSDGRDQKVVVVVVGAGFDIVELICMLRKKVGPAHVTMVGPGPIVQLAGVVN